MASKDESVGCLIIVGLVGGYFLIVKVVWPLVCAIWLWVSATCCAIWEWVSTKCCAIWHWVSAHTGTVWTILAAVGLVVILWLVVRKVLKSQSERRLFDGVYGSWLQGADAKLDAAEKFVADDELSTKKIAHRISNLEKAVRGSH